MRRTTIRTSILTLSLATVATGCGGGGGEPANTPPIAEAGPNQTVDESVTVTLDGSGSRDAEGSITYSWIQTSGTTVTLSSDSAVRPTFESPLLLADELLVFRLTVTDANGASSFDDVSIQVVHANLLPTADAGPDQAVLAGTFVVLDGSASSDLDGTLT